MRALAADLAREVHHRDAFRRRIARSNRSASPVPLPPPAPAAQVAVVEQAVPSDSIALFDDEMRRQSVPAALDLQRAHAYMLHHAHHVALNNRSVVPFVKVAAFESTK